MDFVLTPGYSSLHLDFAVTPEVVKYIEAESKLISEIQKKTEKATNVPATYLKIGHYEVRAMTEGHLIAKFYYKKKKLVWEILEGPLKKKIEIPWFDISGIAADLNSGILKVELNERPSLEKEKEPQPGNHTIWEESDMDFTGGQASKYRIHTIHFAPDTLDHHYETLLRYCDPLYKLSKCSFPTELALTFDENIVPMFPLPPPFDYPDLNRVVSVDSNSEGNNVLSGEGNIHGWNFQHSTLNTRGMAMMNPAIVGNNVSNSIPQIFDNEGMAMNTGMESNESNTNPMYHTGRTMMNPVLENGTPNTMIAQHISTMPDTKGAMNHRLENNNASNNNVPHVFNTRPQNMVAEGTTMMMSPVIKTEPDIDPYFSNNPQQFNGTTLNTGMMWNSTG